MLARSLKVCFALLFVAAGGNHFLNARLYLRIMPPYLPQPLALVYISGFFEIVLGGLLLTRLRRFAAWGLIALLIAIFPANLHMALHTGAYRKIAPAFIWARLPLQAALIAWAYRYTRKTE